MSDFSRRTKQGDSLSASPRCTCGRGEVFHPPFHDESCEMYEHPAKRAYVEAVMRELRNSPLIAALERGENDWAFVYNLAEGVELSYEVRRALAAVNLKLIREALAKSRAVATGPRPELQSSAAEGIGCEGIVTVWDHDGRYLGCMGVNLWQALSDAYTTKETQLREALDAITAVRREGRYNTAEECRAIAGEALGHA